MGWFQINNLCWLIAELLFHLTAACLTSVVERRPVIMIFLMQQVSVMIESTHVVGSLSWKDGMSVITVVQTSYDPSDNSYLSLKHLPQELHLCSGFHFTSWMSTFVPSTICLSCLSLHLYYSILFTNAHHWISWRSELSSAISFFQL